MIKRLSDNGFTAKLSESFEGKTAAGIALAYIDDVLGLITKLSELAADRSKSLLSDRLLEQDDVHHNTTPQVISLQTKGSP